MTKTVYVSLIADIFHAGHVRLIQKSSKYGKVIIGLLTEKACSEIGEYPLLNFEKRKEVLSSIIGVSKIIKQEEASYLNNLQKIKPDFVFHGDDWKNNYQ